MASEFKHLEYLPLDEENLIVNDDPESNLKSKSCLNLGFIASNSVTRNKNILEINKNSFVVGNTFLDLSYSLESYLINLINLNSISNPANTELTKHYKERQLNISSNKILPSFGYCQNLTFTKFKTWGGFYGTLSYYLNLAEEYEEYLSPSEVAYYSFKQLINYSKQVSYSAYLNKNDINYSLITDFYNQTLNLINEESIEADKSIYNLSINIILSCPLVKEIYRELLFYEKWLIKVEDWSVNQNQNSSEYAIVTNPSTNKERAINTLLEILNTLKEEGVKSNDLEGASSNFIKQNIFSNIINVVSKLNLVRVNSTYINIAEEEKTLGELLVIELLNNVSKFRMPYEFKNACNLIQETYAPPGGYAFFLIGIATMLLNRAYILSYQNIKNTEVIETNETYRRIINLIGLSSILLIKSELPHAQIMGINALSTFRLYIDNIDPLNLLDEYS
jgi:hypothetical protein